MKLAHALRCGTHDSPATHSSVAPHTCAAKPEPQFEYEVRAPGAQAGGEKDTGAPSVGTGRPSYFRARRLQRVALA